MLLLALGLAPRVASSVFRGDPGAEIGHLPTNSPEMLLGLAPVVTLGYLLALGSVP